MRDKKGQENGVTSKNINFTICFVCLLLANFNPVSFEETSSLDDEIVNNKRIKLLKKNLLAHGHMNWRLLVRSHVF